MTVLAQVFTRLPMPLAAALVGATAAIPVHLLVDWLRAIGFWVGR
jgi:hypothetical protein